MSRSRHEPTVNTPRSSKMSRRTFGRKAAGVAAVSLSPLALFGRPAESIAAAPATPENPSERRSSRPAGQASGTIETVNLKLSNIVDKYGKRLSGEQRHQLEGILAYNAKMMKGIHSIKLQNGDPPASVLKISFDKRQVQTKEKSSSQHEERARYQRTNPDGKGR